MSSVIKVENLSKQYRLGAIGTGSLSHDLNRWWHTLRGKENPYLKIGETNDRSTKGGSEYVWSLKDLNFEIEQGDAVGIIGRNGAGKSTLLKILSRVTGPTTGSVKIKGRIASLLEVGTGFHPELSGRENIFLNGAILGMRKHEIQKKLEEIIDFSGVERYIDTPVKRYSSGMYVRLAFAVAAHLESEILIVDEVLAVGDAEFQKKCLGKMGEVNKGDGRTVLFVSHNMASVLNLCKSGIILSNGTQKFMGSINKATEIYLGDNEIELDNIINLPSFTEEELLNQKKGKIRKAEILNNSIKNLDDFRIQITFETSVDIEDMVIGIGINTLTAVRLITVENLEQLISIKAGKIVSTIIEIPNIALAPGQYTVSLGIRPLSYKGSYDYLPTALKFEIISTIESIQLSDGPELGTRPKSNWEYQIV
jgi:lipopolysaccharide transport system ATP-binding protein